MKKFIDSEMMIHIPLCTHKEPKNILIISDNGEDMANEVKKHDSIESTVVKANLDSLRDIEDKSFDVVVSQMGADAAVAAHINRILKDDGLMVSSHPDLDDTQANKTFMQILANYYKIIMPYNLGNGSTALLASKAYHPTADIILQRSDMLDNLSYYNCDIHIAAFAMPNYIRKNYLTIIKN